MKDLAISKTRRRLPHWKIDGVIYWITFRLADSIPREKFADWKACRDTWIRTHPEPWSENEWGKYNQLFGDQWEAWLDEGMGSRALGREDVRELVKASILRFDGERLDLHAAVIMPTHVHLLLEPLPVEERQTGMSAPHSCRDLSMLLKGIKGSSARAVNKILGTTGTFWLDESFDHIVRSESQYRHFQDYVAENPAKARLKEDEYWLLQSEADIPVCHSESEHS